MGLVDVKLPDELKATLEQATKTLQAIEVAANEAAALLHEMRQTYGHGVVIMGTGQKP